MNYISNSKSYVRLEAVIRNTFVLIVKIRLNADQQQRLKVLINICFESRDFPGKILDFYRYIDIISPNKTNIMGNLLYVIAVILVIGWAIGFFAYSAGSVIHLLLVIALIAIIFRIIQGRKVV